MEHLEQRFEMATACADMAIWDSTLVAGKLIDGTVVWRGDGARLLWRDGTGRWLAARARIMDNGTGQPARTLGMIWDVTGRVLAAIARAARSAAASHSTTSALACRPSAT